MLLRDRPRTIRRYLGGDLNVWTIRAPRPISLVFPSRPAGAAPPELSFQVHPRAWGRGYAFKACAAVRDHALGPMSHGRVVAETQTLNLPSRRLLECLGFTLAGAATRFGTEQAIYTT